jgi:hypothetical protein
LAAAQATIRDLQTRLGHATLERDEARDAARLAAAMRAPVAEPVDIPVRRRGRPAGSKNRSPQVIGTMQEGFPQTADAGDSAGQRSLSEPSVSVSTPLAAPPERHGRQAKSNKKIRKARTPNPKPVRWW